MTQRSEDELALAGLKATSVAVAREFFQVLARPHAPPEGEGCAEIVQHAPSSSCFRGWLHGRSTNQAEGGPSFSKQNPQRVKPRLMRSRRGMADFFSDGCPVDGCE